jgi:uncharacterized membrane protein
MIVMGIVMTVSILINILLIWYIFNLLKKFFFISNNVEDLSDTLTGLVEHLDQVHSLETFYGEPVLQGLLRHTRDVVEEVGQYMAIYEVVEEGDKPEVEEEEQEEQEIDE